MNAPSLILVDEKTALFTSSEDTPPSPVPISSIILAGEFTTEDGPYADDHMLAFWLDDGRVLEFPVATPGASELLTKIGEISNEEIDVKLTLNTSFSSKVLHPLEYRGSELFEFVKKRKGLGGLFFNNVMERRLRPVLATFVESRAKAKPTT